MSHILVIDDKRTERGKLHTALSKRGHVVTSVGTPVPELELKSLEQYQAAIVDITLDESDQAGYRCMRRLRDASPKMIIIAVTSAGTNVKNYEAMQAGADYFVRRVEGDAATAIDMMLAWQPARLAVTSRWLNIAALISLGSAIVSAIAFKLGMLGTDGGLYVNIAIIAICLATGGKLRLSALEWASVLKTGKPGSDTEASG